MYSKMSRPMFLGVVRDPEWGHLTGTYKKEIPQETKSPGTIPGDLRNGDDDFPRKRNGVSGEWGIPPNRGPEKRGTKNRNAQPSPQGVGNLWMPFPHGNAMDAQTDTGCGGQGTSLDNTITHFRAEVGKKVKIGQAKLVAWDSINNNPPAKLEISPIAAISHKSKQFCSILDLPFHLRLKQGVSYCR